jgi:predicted nicotinamide N-methyase
VKEVIRMKRVFGLGFALGVVAGVAGLLGLAWWASGDAAVWEWQGGVAQ